MARRSLHAMRVKLDHLHIVACAAFWGLILAAPMIGWRMVSGTWHYHHAGTLLQWKAMAAGVPVWLADFVLYGRWLSFYERRTWR